MDCSSFRGPGQQPREPGMFDQSAVQDWLRIHRQLVQEEAQFAEVAMRTATGEVRMEELQEKRVHLMAMRELCAAVYEKAFTRPGSHEHESR
jgi:hypothetical protein